jgi:hypothetical protein
MGGSTTSTNTQSSQTAPWAAAQPLLNGILGQLGGNLANTGITNAQTNAINAIEGNSGTEAYRPAVNNITSSLLAGGGALNQAPAVQAAYDQFRSQTNPLASNTNYNPYSTPGFSDAINTLTSDITNNVNGQFAAAGRDMSPANSQALARGIMQGVSPVIASQYNQNVQNQQNAAGNLYNAGNTNAGILSGMQQQYNANGAAGINSIGTGLHAENSGPAAILGAEAQRFGIPVQNLGLLANIGIPIAGLGSQASGQSQTEKTDPWYTQLSGAANGISSAIGLLGML